MIMSEIRYALRRMRARPGFAAIVLITLALGIGVNTAIFSAVHGLLLRPFPYEEPDRLVRISVVKGDEEGPISIPELDELAELTSVLAGVAAYTDQGQYNASGFGAPEELLATITTHNLFELLGTDLLLGDVWPAHYDRSRNFALILSHELWMRRFGGDPQVVGRTMTLDGAPGYEIFGVLSPGFNFPSRSDIFRSAGIVAEPEYYERRDVRQRMAVARLQPGVSLGQARGAIEALGARLARDFPETNADLQFRVVPLRDLFVGDVRPYLVLLSVAVGLVLLIACANVVSLLLSRAIDRERELAIRTALGAGRGRLTRQVMVESLLYAVGGGMLSLAVAWWAVRVIDGMVLLDLPEWMSLTVDWPVVAFLFVLAVVTGVVTGLVPALRGSDAHDLSGTLREGTRGSSAGLRHHRVRSLLIVGEVALALVLVVGAGLLLQSVRQLQRSEPGFDSHDLLTFRVELGWQAYGTEGARQFHDQALPRLAALPGVENVGLDDNLPLSGKPRDPVTIVAEGMTMEELEAAPFINLHRVSHDYFEMMRIPLVGGRGFEPLDIADTQPVAVVSERLARRLWPNAEGIGQRVRTGDMEPDDPWVTVVGIAGDVRFHDLSGDGGLDIYRPYRQATRTSGPYYLLRTAGDPLRVAQAATAIIGDIDPDQSFFDVQPMESRIHANMWQRRAAGSLFGTFAALALLLACVGLYGLLSFVVGQRTRELGVRLALGAQPSDVARMVVGQGLSLVAAGIALGLVGAAALARAAGGMLYDVSALDPLTFVAAPVVLAAVGGLATLVPTLRALHVEPTEALKAE